MTTITLRCSCPPQRYTAAGPQPCDPACPVHGITAREAASLRQRVETLESALREVLRAAPDEGYANRSSYIEHGALCDSRFQKNGEQVGPCNCGHVEWTAACDAARAAIGDQAVSETKPAAETLPCSCTVFGVAGSGSPSTCVFCGGDMYARRLAAAASLSRCKEALRRVIRKHGHSNTDTDCCECGDAHAALSLIPQQPTGSVEDALRFIASFGCAFAQHPCRDHRPTQPKLWCHPCTARAALAAYEQSKGESHG